LGSSLFFRARSLFAKYLRHMNRGYVLQFSAQKLRNTPIFPGEFMPAPERTPSN
jgi:hypothetical protein